LSDLLDPLSDEHLLLLRTMATEYLRSSRWPMWHFVQATLNREDLDADQLLDSLPRVGGRWFAKPYRLAWWDDGPTENSRPGLTIAAVHHVPDLLPVMGQPFLLVLRKLVEIQRNLPLSPDEIKTVAYTPDDIRRVLPSISDLFSATDVPRSPARKQGCGWMGQPRAKARQPITVSVAHVGAHCGNSQLSPTQVKLGWGSGAGGSRLGEEAL
jgi:hypothetical protein